MKSRSVFEAIKSLYSKYRRPILYVLFGFITTGVNLLCYTLFAEIMRIEELTSNALAWIFAVLAAFLTNRIWVFESHTHGKGAFVRQMLSFYAGRVVTLLIEELILLVFVKIMNFDGMVVKVLAQIIVIALNYVVSTIFIFRK